MKLQDFQGLIDTVHRIELDAVSQCTLTYLHNLVEKALAEMPIENGNQQVTVLITSRDNIYYGDTDAPDWGAELIRQLQEQNDTHVTHLVTAVRYCADGSVKQSGFDITSYNFRKMLMDLDRKNAYALFVMRSEECLRARTVLSSMSEKDIVEYSA